jgi:hypothetical protein
MDYPNEFRIKPGTRVSLKGYDPGFRDKDESKKSGLEKS